MDLSLLIIIGILAVGFFLIYLQLNKGTAKNDDAVLRVLNENFNARMREMTQQFNEQTKQINLRLKENSEILQKSNRHIGDRLDTAAKVVSGVTEKLGKLQEATKQMTDVGRDIASLQDILRAPKLRGSLGEFFLGDLLAQYFPKDQFSMPYTFRSGEKVDAALHVADGHIVPIDAKFPLENFKKMIDTKDEKERRVFQKAFVSDVKRRIDEISRYILPDEGTMDFALLYIPAENVYYEVIVKDEGDDSLSTYAFKKRVIPVSPNNFFVYLQTILMGLRGLQIEKSAKVIQEALVRLKGDFEKFDEDFDVLGGHITNAGNKFDESRRRLERLGAKLTNIELVGEKEKSKLLK
ncbi:DNA recombination protein RmuC [Candidatus Peregrinibacteria bacterium]|nr:DNA recombination protein RmuC [Candidatus Peregrinibacteria bacterium]